MGLCSWPALSLETTPLFQSSFNFLLKKKQSISTRTMGLSGHVFLIHGLIELCFGLINLLTSNKLLLPGDTAPEATSLALLSGQLWSYAIICLGIASLLIAHAHDSDTGKRILGITGLLYNSFIVGSAGYRAYRGWIFIGNRSGISWHITGMVIHGTIAMWFLIWLVQAMRSGCADESEGKLAKPKYLKVDINQNK